MNTLLGQCGLHWSNAVRSGGWLVIAIVSSHKTVSTPPVSHRNRRSAPAGRRPVGWASIRYANSSGMKPVNTTPTLNRSRLLEPLRSHSDDSRPAPTSSPPILAWTLLVCA